MTTRKKIKNISKQIDDIKKVVNTTRTYIGYWNGFPVYVGGNVTTWGTIQGTLSDQTDLQKVIDSFTTAVTDLNTYCDNLDATKAAQTDLETEASTRSANDLEISNNLAKEVEARASADSSLQGEITDEATARTNADTNLQTEIDNINQTTLPALEQSLEQQIATKQDTLVSGTTIKTINGETLLGSGNVEVPTIPTAPTSGEYVLKCINGTIQWEKVNKPLCFTSTGTSTIQLTITETLTDSVDIYYSRDNTNWNTWLSGTSGSSDTITLNDSEKLYVWNKNSTLSESSSKYVKFVMTGSLAASGNVSSMINYVELSDYCYCRMFYDCTSLTQAPELPATTLASYCYYYMFRGCTSLTTAPELPATTLADYCYRSMFSGCTSLTTAPELPATTLASSCYSYMFYGCTSLTTAPELPATTLASSCYSYMFYGCTSLTTAPELPATTLANYCYYDMFYDCTSLTQAPELPATTLADSCYYEMFRGCTSLTTAPELPATTLANYCYFRMFYGCTSLKVNENGTEGTTIFTCPSYSVTSPVTSMFANTGGTFTGTPTAGNTYKYE